jgi:endogenous inhibitor of DNA gyrase (YacG/DUF329 family)
MPECPHCGKTAFMPCIFDCMLVNAGGVIERECESCGKPIKIMQKEKVA